MMQQNLDAKMHLRLEPELRAALEAVAKAEGRTLSNAARRLIVQGLAQSQLQQPAKEPAASIFLEV